MQQAQKLLQEKKDLAKAKIERQIAQLRRKRDDAKLAFDKAEDALCTCQQNIQEAETRHKQALQELHVAVAEQTKEERAGQEGH